MVVVAIDGVRWEEVFLGLDGTRVAPSKQWHEDASTPPARDFLREMHAIADTTGVLLGGDCSRVFVSSKSAVSLPGYAELFSGRTPSCHDNECPDTQTQTLLDQWQQMDPSAVLALVSSWSPLLRVAAMERSNLVVSAGRDRENNLDGLRASPRVRNLLDAGRFASPYPGSGTYRPDRYTAPIALETLDILRPRFLFIGLGDTDEHAHQDRYQSYIAAVRAADDTVGRVHRWLNGARRAGKRTLLVVTTDHGRARTFRHHGDAPEARRIWMLLSGDPVAHWGRPKVRDSRLADLAPTLRAELGMAPDLDPAAGESRGDWLRLEEVGASNRLESHRFDARWRDGSAVSCF